MTAPGTGSERPQQVVVVGPDGRPVGTMPMPARTTTAAATAARRSARWWSSRPRSCGSAR